MGLFSWDRTPAKNANVDPSIAAQDTLSARALPGTIRSFMAGMRRFADDAGGALTTTGQQNAYVLTTNSGLPELRPGLALLVRADRDNTAVATLNVDGLGPLPWVDAGGVSLQPGRILKDRYYSVIYEPEDEVWRVQAGASTLDEIPGLTDLQSDVGAKSMQVAADRAAVATDRATVQDRAAAAVNAATATAADRALAAGSAQAATGAATTATSQSALAQQAASQANAAIASGSVNFDTYDLLIAGTTGASPAYPTALAAYVNFDIPSLTGFYTRTSTAAQWVRQSLDTVMSTSQRSRTSVLGLDGLRDLVLYRDALNVTDLGFVDLSGKMPLSFDTVGRASLAGLTLLGDGAPARDGSPFAMSFYDTAGHVSAGVMPSGEFYVDGLVGGLAAPGYRDAVEYAYPIHDNAGRVSAGVAQDGSFFMSAPAMGADRAGYRDATPFAASFSGRDGRAPLGFKEDGSTVLTVASESLPGLAAALGVTSGGIVPVGWRDTVSGETVLRVTPDALGTYQFGLIREPDQTVITAVQAVSPTAPTTAMVWHYSPISGVLWYGQSNAGKGSSTDPADQTVPVYPHNVVTFGGGLAAGTDDPVDPAGLTTLKPQADDGGATWQSVAYANAEEGLARFRGRKTPGLFSWTVWKGSTPLTNFVRGTVAWDNLMAGIDAMPVAAGSLARKIKLDVINVVQGESGPGSAVSTALSRSTYFAVCAPFYQDLRNEAALHGPKNLPWIYVAQVNRAVQDTIPPGVALAQWDAALAQRYQGVVLIPMYMCPIAPGTGVHPGDVGRMVYGETVKVIKDVTDTGTPFNALWPKTNGTALAADWVARTAAIIKIKLDRPPGGGPIAFDTSWVPAVQNMGFVYSDDSSGATIQSVAISGVDEVTITLTADPGAAANKRIFYAQDNPEFIRNEATENGWAKGRGNLVSPTGISSFYFTIGKNVPPTINHYCIRFEGVVP